MFTEPAPQQVRLAQALTTCYNSGNETQPSSTATNFLYCTRSLSRPVVRRSVLDGPLPHDAQGVVSLRELRPLAKVFWGELELSHVYAVPTRSRCWRRGWIGPCPARSGARARLNRQQTERTKK
jgi:hypothetical protein